MNQSLTFLSVERYFRIPFGTFDETLHAQSKLSLARNEYFKKIQNSEENSVLIGTSKM